MGRERTGTWIIWFRIFTQKTSVISGLYEQKTTLVILDEPNQDQSGRGPQYEKELSAESMERSGRIRDIFCRDRQKLFLWNGWRSLED